MASGYFYKHVTISLLSRKVVHFGIAGFGAGVAYYCSSMFYPRATSNTIKYHPAPNFRSSDNDEYYVCTQEYIEPLKSTNVNEEFSVLTTGFDMLSSLTRKSPEPKEEVQPLRKIKRTTKTPIEEFDLDTDTVYIHLRSLNFPEESIREVMKKQIETQKNYNISQLITELTERHPLPVVFADANKYEIYGHSTSITRCNPSESLSVWNARPDIDVKGNIVNITGSGKQVSKIHISTTLNTTASVNCREVIAADKRKRLMTAAIFGVATDIAFSRVLRKSPVFTGPVMRNNIPLFLVVSTLATPVFAALIATPFWTAQNLYFGVFHRNSRGTHETFVNIEDKSHAKRISNFFELHFGDDSNMLTVRTEETKYKDYSMTSAVSQIANLNGALGATFLMLLGSPFITVPATICFSTIAGVLLLVTS